MDISVVLAVYNEELCIGKELNIIKDALDKTSYAYEIIVVDDGSTDRTSKIIENYPWVRLIRYTVNKGVGEARKLGTKMATADTIVWTDVDMSYPNESIPGLVKELKENKYDQVIATRSSEEGNLKLFRVTVKWFIQKLAAFLIKKPIHDLNSGMRVFKKDIALKYLDLLPSGFSCTSTLTLAFICNGYSVAYFPIEYRKRVGKSKFHPIIDTYRYIKYVVKIIWYFYNIKNNR